LNFSCDKCQRRYSIADEKVRGKTVKVRCKNCQNVISVQGPPLEMEESTRVVALADVEKIREQERLMAAAAAGARPYASASTNPWEDEPTRAASTPARPPAQWFVMVKSKQEGPLDEAGLQELVDSGAANARSFFWQQGMADWKRGLEIPELASFFSAPPAPPPPPPPAPPALPPEPATIAMRGGPRNGAPAAQLQVAPAQDDGAWDDVPTTVGQAPAVREPWDLDPPVAAQPQQRQAQRQQQQPAWDEPAPQQDQPAWDDGSQGAEAAQQDQPAWDEPAPQQDQPAWDEPAPREEEAPAPKAAARVKTGSSKAVVGDDLFSDLDLPDKNEPVGEPMVAGAGDDEGPDPLAAVRGNKAARDEKKPVEDTRYFMKKSGVTRRNPFWKVALVLMLPILLVVGGASVLGMVLTTKVVNAQGQTVEKPLLLSSEGRNELRDLLLSDKGRGELRDLLLGRNKPPPAPTPAPPEKKPAPPAGTQPPGAGATEPKPAVPETGKSAEELEQLYADSAKPDVGPEVRKNTEVAAKDAESQGGPPADDIAKVVEKSQGAFQGCVETELRRNPRFKGGKVLLKATVGTSGIVKSTKLDRRELDGSAVGECIKKSAKRMVFPAFKMEDGSNEVDLEIPLVLSSGER
jgi:predicted Zn finger-like uncharacterized protein